ncbi:PLD nuclease N-terminal domain-containing protein [Rhodococcoides kroppenstedtii]|uniref:PLD nuclease N-terminal domain-containing protein n=1 Tax=Rhodococcoides kroppenstedtii TaxID=293050 RepID=UPI0036442596
MPYLGLLVMALWVFSLIDVVTADDSGIRHLPKVGWLLLVLFIPLIGSLLWLTVGRPIGGGVWGGSGPSRRGPASGFAEYDIRPGRAVAQDPEADAEFLRQCRARAEEQRRIERERRRADGY